MAFTNNFSLYIDESGDSNLNHPGKYFILSTVILSKYDFEIIEGYLRLLKREYLGDDLKIIHTTDLFERPYKHYRRLLKPKSRINYFIKDLHGIFKNIPYLVGLYIVDKDLMRMRLGYKPGRGKKPTNFNIDKPYEICATEAINNFTQFLIENKSMGEIITESRFNQDINFVRYFNSARQVQLPGGIINPLARDVMQRINSLHIANKRIVNGGLEIADICAYTTYRHLNGDPNKYLKVNISLLNTLLKIIKTKVYVTGNRGKKLKELNI